MSSTAKISLAKGLHKFSTYTILVWPIRLLVIISSLLIPVLLGLIIWFYRKHENQINEVINQTKTIEGMIVNNLEKGIQVIKDEIGGDITADNINKFFETKLWPKLKVVLVNYYNQVNDEIKSIKIDASNLDDIKITYKGNTTEIKNMETFIKTEINIILKDIIPQIEDALRDNISGQLGGNQKDTDNKMKELNSLLLQFSNNSNNTLGYIMTQYELFYKS